MSSFKKLKEVNYNLNLEKKKIFFVISPHINYYHSYRGDSRGVSGFGKDITLMRQIIDKIDEIEDSGLCNGKVRMTWDYADTFWSMQLQKEYQQDVLDRVIERCKKGKDEVLIGSWANVAQPILDTEEFILQHEWYLENSMGIGLNQLFKGRIAPYARTQETMFTQGMIELYNKLGVEGFCMYYSVYPFDVGRPFLNPRLNANQRYGLVKFKSSISNASIIMIPMYAFGDVPDYFSIKRWFRLIRKMQKRGEISGHALLFFNFDMDYEDWIGHKLPKILQWMPKTRGLNEFAEAVDQLEYVEFGNLLDIIPKLEVDGETILYQDAADGNWNGFYNWAQKYDNTEFWTVGQRARWLKCITDTLISQKLVENKKSEINKFIREGDDSSETYIKNKLLFASTTNFGMSMPFQHPDRKKTALSYGLKAHFAAENAVELAINEMVKNIFNNFRSNDYGMLIAPIINRGITNKEKIDIKSDIFIKTEIPFELSDKINKEHKFLNIKNKISEDTSNNHVHLERMKYRLYKDEPKTSLILEGFIPINYFKSSDISTSILSIFDSKDDIKQKEGEIKATLACLKNQLISLKFNDKGKPISFIYDGEELGCLNFLESSVTFGEFKNTKKYSSKYNKIIVLRDGSDGFSASVKIISEFEIVNNSTIIAEKIITLYSNIPKLFVKVSMNISKIEGKQNSIDGTSYVSEQYDNRWQEIIPCEIKPNIIGNNTPLRVWKRNFLGNVSYFDLDMREVDPRNSDIDCLVANISDGWMAISNRSKGILIGFNSLEAANFAFSPIKIRNGGFGDGYKKGQQIRINPFGTYYGELLHYWTKGSGHAYKVTKKFLGTDRSTAPTFNGKNIVFELVIAPYNGDRPSEELQSFVDHFSLPPLILIGKKDGSILVENYSKYGKKAESLKNEFDIEALMNITYLEWVREVNKNYDPAKEVIPQENLNLGLRLMLMMLIDGIRGR